MDRNSVDWKGYIPAVTTPFTEAGELDGRAWQELVEWLVSEGMHGIIVGGTTGEWFSMTQAERVEQFRLAAVQVRGRIPVIGGCNSYTPQDAIALAEAAQEAGLDGILLTPPPYVVTNRRETIAFYQAVSDAVAIPICVYNWPRGTGVDMDADTVSAIADIEHVVGIKNSTPNVGNFVETLAAVKDRLRVFGFPFNEFGVSLLQGIGGDGTMGAGAVLGRDHPEFWNRLWAGDVDGALAVGRRDRAVFDAWIRPDFSAPFASPQAIFKEALNLQGLPGGHVRPPLLPLTPDERDSVRETLIRLGRSVAGR